VFFGKISLYEVNEKSFMFLNFIDVRVFIMLSFKSMFRIISVFSKSEFELIKFEKKIILQIK
jgi:hypothetical protein